MIDGYILFNFDLHKGWDPVLNTTSLTDSDLSRLSLEASPNSSDSTSESVMLLKLGRYNQSPYLASLLVNPDPSSPRGAHLQLLCFFPGSRAPKTTATVNSLRRILRQLNDQGVLLFFPSLFKTFPRTQHQTLTKTADLGLALFCLMSGNRVLVVGKDPSAVFSFSLSLIDSLPPVPASLISAAFPVYHITQPVSLVGLTVDPSRFSEIDTSNFDIVMNIDGNYPQINVLYNVKKYQGSSALFDAIFACKTYPSSIRENYLKTSIIKFCDVALQTRQLIVNLSPDLVTEIENRISFAAESIIASVGSSFVVQNDTFKFTDLDKIILTKIVLHELKAFN
ncbi:MAG: hypothetical protein ACTSYA_08000 [Candidatus Kariarchaeaceae archaeon]